MNRYRMHVTYTTPEQPDDAYRTVLYIDAPHDRAAAAAAFDRTHDNGHHVIGMGQIEIRDDYGTWIPIPSRTRKAVTA